jgi:hypothetical protein
MLKMLADATMSGERLRDEILECTNANVNVNAIWNEKEKNFFYHVDDDLDRVEMSCYEHC